MRCEDFELRLNQLLDLGDQIEDLSWDPELHRHSVTCPSCRSLHRGYCLLQAGFAMLAAEQWSSGRDAREPEKRVEQSLTTDASTPGSSTPRVAIWSARTLAFVCSVGIVVAFTCLLLVRARLLPLPHGVGKLLDVATRRLERPQPIKPPRPLPEETVPGEAAIRSLVSRVPSIASDVLQRAVPVDEATGEPLWRMVSYLLDPQPLDDALPEGVLPTMWSEEEQEDAASTSQNGLWTGSEGSSS